MINLTSLFCKFASCATLIVFSSNPSLAQSLTCKVTKKFDVFSDRFYTDEELTKWQFSVQLNETVPASVSRCSYSSSANAVTCDTYYIDREEIAAGFVDIMKYYYFGGQLDLQIFDGENFIENNGRGSIATGKCVAS